MQRMNSLRLFDKFLKKEAQGKRAENPTDIETQDSFFQKRRKAEKIMANPVDAAVFNDKLRIR